MTANVSVDTVSPGQVIAARAYIRRTRYPDLVSEHIVAVANLPLEEVSAAWAQLPINEGKIQAAQLLIELRGGEDKVGPEVVAMAHATVPKK